MEKGKTKIYFIDLDGTLLDKKRGSKETISQKNLKAIEKAQSDGIKIVISTGRLKRKLENFYSILNLDYFITSCGGIITDGKKNILKEYFFKIEEAKEIVEFAKKYNLSLIVNDGKYLYGGYGRFKSFIAKKFSYEILKKNYVPKKNKKYYKIVLVGKRRSKMIEIKNHAKEIFKNLSIVGSINDYTIEFTHIEANKGLASKYICQEYGINKKYAVHIGDSMNDIATANYVNQLIIMKNGTEITKKYATKIGPNYKKGGVAKILNERW